VLLMDQSDRKAKEFGECNLDLEDLVQYLELQDIKIVAKTKKISVYH